MTDVIVKKETALCRVTLCREYKKNALTHAMYQCLAEAIEYAEQDEEIRCILIEAEGDYFCAGNDLHDFAATKDSDKLADNVRFMNALVKCRLPVVVKVQGHAVGIGVTMLLHCDLVLCAENATFTLPFVDLGLVPEFSSSYLLPKLAGHRKAAKALMLAEPFNVAEAEVLGLVTESVAPEVLNERVDTVIRKLCKTPRMALRNTKALMQPEQEEILLHMNDELDIFSDLLPSPAAQEAFSAILEKREPDPQKYN